MTRDSDLGLFGPGSVTWRIHADPILLVAGLRALYLQALHPRAMAGISQNSSYKSDPWGRLIRTANDVATVVYGTTAEAEAAGRRLAALHARMKARDPFTGEEFRADDPELLRWVGHGGRVIPDHRPPGRRRTVRHRGQRVLHRAATSRSAGRTGPGVRAGHRRSGADLLPDRPSGSPHDPGCDGHGAVSHRSPSAAARTVVADGAAGPEPATAAIPTATASAGQGRPASASRRSTPAHDSFTGASAPAGQLRR